MVTEEVSQLNQFWGQRKRLISDWNSLSTAETGLDESDNELNIVFDEGAKKRMKPLRDWCRRYAGEPVRENYFDHHDRNYVEVK